MIVFDTYHYVKELRAVGFTEAQAEVQSNTLKILVENDLVTKQDLELTKLELQRDTKSLDAKIELTKAELQRDIKSLEAKIESSKVELLKWLIGLMIAQTGIIIALVKLMPNVSG